ncbi:MAG: putative membrane protein [Halonotius sp. J07HN6]|jgi:Predicted membrane protein|nr:MAG: putative membrane protein [Halonotius sp. J07HN6]
MSPPAVQDDPTASSSVTAEPDLDWLSVDDDESIRWASTPHKYSVVPGLVIGIPLSFVLIGIPILIGSYLQYTNTNYVVTNKGLYSKRGILSRDVQQIGFDKVQNISYSQSAVGSSLGYGSVDVSTAGGSGVELKFRSIPEPAAVQELIAREIDSRQQDGTDEPTQPTTCSTRSSWNCARFDPP